MTSRSLASISAGPVLGSRISSSPQSALTATSPPSLTTASTATARPAVLNSRHRPRAADRSWRASTSTASAVPASSREDGSAGAVRTVCGSSDNDGSTGSGCSSEVSSSSSNEPLQLWGKGIPQIRNTIWRLRPGHLTITCDLALGFGRCEPVDGWEPRGRLGHNSRMRRMLVGVISWRSPWRSSSSVPLSSTTARASTPNTDCRPRSAKRPIWGRIHSSPSWRSRSCHRRCAATTTSWRSRPTPSTTRLVGKATLEATMYSIDLTYASWLIRPDAKLPVGKLESRIIIDSMHLGRYLGINDLMVEAPLRRPTTPPAEPPNRGYRATTAWCSAARRSRRTSTAGSASRSTCPSPPTTRRRWCSPRPAS